MFPVAPTSSFTYIKVPCSFAAFTDSIMEHIRSRNAGSLEGAINRLISRSFDVEFTDSQATYLRSTQIEVDEDGLLSHVVFAVDALVDGVKLGKQLEFTIR